MAFCLLGLAEGGVLELAEEPGYLALAGPCVGEGGGAITTYGHIPDWWDAWKKEQERKYRMRIPSKQRIAELAASLDDSKLTGK